MKIFYGVTNGVAIVVIASLFGSHGFDRAWFLCLTLGLISYTLGALAN